jgi:hydroxymethylpyrimidine/phosphomethylpyrimidine kinase
VTAQNTVGVTAVSVLPAEIVTAQIEAVASDITLAATKTGMLATPAIVEAVAAAVRALELPRLVLDPVMLAKSGDRLLDADAIRALCTELIPQALVVTPNLPEAEVLTKRPIANLDDARDAARRIADMGASAVIIKGGHGTGDPLVDLLFAGGEFFEFRTPRLDTRHTHGTGCTFASAVAAHLALGYAIADATERAQRYVAGAIRSGLPIGRGHGPLDHFWNSHPGGRL